MVSGRTRPPETERKVQRRNLCRRKIHKRERTEKTPRSAKYERGRKKASKKEGPRANPWEGGKRERLNLLRIEGEKADPLQSRDIGWGTGGGVCKKTRRIIISLKAGGVRRRGVLL